MKKTALLFVSIILVLSSCEKGQINEKLNYDAAFLKHNTYVTESIKAGSSEMPDYVVSKNGVFQEELAGRVFCQQSAFDLIAGQSILAGAISVSNDEENLYITYKTDDGWRIKEIHLYAGPLDLLPVNAHNVPVPGEFPIKESFDPTVDNVTYEIPLALLEECFYIAAHAVVVKDGQTETAWGKGELSFEESLGISRWGWLINSCPEKCEGKELVVALKSYVVNKGATEESTPIWWVVSNGIGTEETCLGIGFNKFMTDDAGVHVYNLIKWGNPSDIAGTVSVSVTGEGGVNFINVVIELNDPDLELYKSYLYVGTEEGLDDYYYKYKGKDCYTFYNWFFQEDAIEPVHSFSIPIGDIK